MTIVTFTDLRGAMSAADCDRDTIDRLLANAGEFDKDSLDDDTGEYLEQLQLAEALRIKRQRELRREVARARRSHL